MELKIDLFSIINILTIINLVLLSSMLFFRKNNSSPNKLLALIIFIPATSFAVNYLLYTGVLYHHSYLMLITIGFLWPPAVFWYVQLMLGRKVNLNYKIIPHLFLQIIFSCSLIIFCLYDDAYRIHFLEGIFHQRYPYQLLVFNFLLLAQSFAYLSYSLIKINNYVKALKQSGEEMEMMVLKIKWLKEFVLLLITINIFVIILALFIPPETVAYMVDPIMYSIFYILVLYEAFRNSAVFSASQFQQYVENENEKKGKYSNSSLKPAIMDELYKTLLINLETNKPFLQSDISIKRLSDQVNIAPHFLSQIINQKFNKSFPDLINFYRVEEAKNKLKDLKESNYSIEGIGMQCGFGSPSAFYKAFRKNTELTPSQYLNELSDLKGSN
jgi:AraC-like DNA-binding protein